jgi:hypothetical protein
MFSSSELGVGTNYHYRPDGGYDILWRSSLLKFDVQSMIALKTILEAKLIVYQKTLPADFSGSFQVAATKTSWDPSTITWKIWSTQMQHYTTNTINFSALATTTTPLQFDVTSIVQNWANGTWAVGGFQIWEPIPAAPGIDANQAVTFEGLDVSTSNARRPQLFLRFK